MDLIDRLAFHIQDGWSAFMLALGGYGWHDWLLALPLLLVTEAPAFLVAALLLNRQGERDLPPDERQRRLAFLETHPRISVLLVAQDDDAAPELARVLRSWCELEQPGVEILLIDNSPGEAVGRAYRACPESDLVRLWRQHSGVRDRRRGSVFNLALQLAVGELLITADARSSCDQDLLLHLIGPFHENRIGAVTGTCKAVNGGDSRWAALQALEMVFVYGLRKRLLGRWGLHTQGNTVFGAYRRETMQQVGAFEPELTDGLDLALKIRRSGWRTLHAPRAVATLRVPPAFRQALGERLLVDRDWASALFRRHLHPQAWATAGGLALLFTQLGTGMLQPLLYAMLLTWLLISAPALLPAVLLLLWMVNAICCQLAFSAALRISERADEERALRGATALLPLWFMLMRWVRLQAIAWAAWRRLRRLLGRIGA